MEKFFTGLLVLSSFSLFLVLFGFVSSGLALTRVTREFTPMSGADEVCTALEKEKKNPSKEFSNLPANFDPDKVVKVQVYPKTLQELRAESESESEKTSGFYTCPGLAEALDGQTLDQLKAYCPCKRGRLASCALAIITCIVQLALNIAVIVTVFILKKLKDVKNIWMINSILFGICLLLCVIALALAAQFNMKDSPDDIEQVFAPSPDPNLDGLIYFVWLCLDVAFCLIALIILLVLKFLKKSKSAQDGAGSRKSVASTPSKNSKGAGSGGSNKSRGTRSSTRSSSRNRTNKNVVAPASQSLSQTNENQEKIPSNGTQSSVKASPSLNSVKKNPSNRNVK